MVTEQLLSRDKLTLIDISLPISSKTACFPGDVSFKRDITLTLADSQVVNLTALTMSPHVGTHTDSPSHVRGDMNQMNAMAGAMPLHPFIGPCFVIDIADYHGEITPDMVCSKIPEKLPERVLVRTRHAIKYDVWEHDYAYFSPALVDFLNEKGVNLIAIDVPSVDYVHSKTLDVHNQLVKRNMYWLENLDLTQVAAGGYFLVALPLKFVELEASPVRAVLIK